MPFKISICHPTEIELPEKMAEVFSYWEEKRGDRIAPAWGEFQLHHLPSDVIPWCVVVDVQRDPLDFVYRFWGTARTMLQGQDCTGSSCLTVLPQEIGKKLFREYSELLQRAAPICVTTKGVDEARQPVQYNFLRLPLSSDGETINTLFSYSQNDGAKRYLHNFFGTELPVGFAFDRD